MSVRRLLNAPFEGLNAIIRAGVSRGLWRQKKAPLPVISVGNITMGGTGKTPLVEALARTLLELGETPAILTRGYRRRGHAPLVLQGDPGPAWVQAGDEPALLASKLPQVPVVVDADRWRGAFEARTRGATCALLDDGFQHWSLARDLDLVVVDARDPLGRKSWRREGPKALAHASRIVCVGPEHQQEIARKVLSRYHPVAPFAAALRPQGWWWHGRHYPVSQIFLRKVLAFAGIANPSRFFDSLAAAGAQVVAAREFPDHHPFTRREVEALLAQAQEQGVIPITTAKDHVRLPPDLKGEVAVWEVALVPLEEDLATLVSPVRAIR